MSSGIEAVIISRPCPSLSHGTTLLLCGWELTATAKHILLPPHQIREAHVWLLWVSLTGPKPITGPGFFLSGGIHSLFLVCLEMGPKCLSSPCVFAIIRSAVKERRKQIPGGVRSYLIRSVFREGKPLQRAEVCFACLCLDSPWTQRTQSPDSTCITTV